MKFKKLAALTTLCATALLSPAIASAQDTHIHADILFGIQNGQLVTLAEEPAETFFFSQVFEGEFPNTFFTDDPGFNNDERAEFPAGVGALTANTDMGFNIKAVAPVGGGTASNLWYWDGTGTANFAPISDGTTLTVSKLISGTTFLTAVADGGMSDVAGYAIDTADGTGGLHQHINFYLLDSSGTGISGVAEGVYVLPLELTQVNVAPSDPFFIVFATETIDESIHEAGVDWVQTSLVPEPASLALLGFGGLTMLRRRRAA